MGELREKMLRRMELKTSAKEQLRFIYTI